MPDAKKKMSPATLAAFLAGAGLGAGTEIIIKPAAPEEPGWACSVLANEQVLCRPMDAIEIPGDDLVVKDLPDAGVRIDPFDGGRDE
jgi:hypothetical protein